MRPGQMKCCSEHTDTKPQRAFLFLPSTGWPGFGYSVSLHLLGLHFPLIKGNKHTAASPTCHMCHRLSYVPFLFSSHLQVFFAIETDGGLGFVFFSTQGKFLLNKIMRDDRAMYGHELVNKQIKSPLKFIARIHRQALHSLFLYI